METQPEHPPIPFTLIECAFRQLTRDMCRVLPPAATEHERTDRIKAAIAQVAALQPVNTAEFELAAQFALASLRSQLDLAKADEPGLTTADALRWNSQSNNKARQANSSLRSLLRLQAERRKTESDPKLYDRGERIEDHMTALMADAVLDPPPVSLHDPEPASPLPPVGESLPPTGSWGGAPRGAINAPGDAFISSPDPESHTKKTETQTRHPPSLPLAGESLPPTQSAVGARRVPGEGPVSHRDPQSHPKKTETPQRHPAPPEKWRAVHLGPVVPLADMIPLDERPPLAPVAASSA